MHALRNAIVKIGRARDGLDPAEPHIFSHIVTYTGECDSDTWPCIP